MKTGTKSILFGVHQFAIHPLFVAEAWRRLYGWPRHPAVYLSFIVHDLGYWGAERMDGEDDGELHPLFGAKIMRQLFGDEWGEFCLYHSRFLAKRYRQPYSRLCVADKLAIALYPQWLYLLLGRASGEIHEYMRNYGTRTVSGREKARRFYSPGEEREWLTAVQAYMRAWVDEHADLKPDTWTNRDAVSAEGVWS